MRWNSIWRWTNLDIPLLMEEMQECIPLEWGKWKVFAVILKTELDQYQEQIKTISTLNKLQLAACKVLLQPLATYTLQGCGYHIWCTERFSSSLLHGLFGSVQPDRWNYGSEQGKIFLLTCWHGHGGASDHPHGHTVGPGRSDRSWIDGRWDAVGLDHGGVMDNVRLCRVHWLGVISSLFEKGKTQP